MLKVTYSEIITKPLQRTLKGLKGQRGPDRNVLGCAVLGDSLPCLSRRLSSRQMTANEVEKKGLFPLH